MIYRKPNLSPELNAALDAWEAASGEVTMTATQFQCLKWLARNGGRGRLEGNQIVMPNGETSGGASLVSFMHLVAAGTIVGEKGEVYITEHGRRWLELTETGKLI